MILQNVTANQCTVETTGMGAEKIYLGGFQIHLNFKNLTFNLESVRSALLNSQLRVKMERSLWYLTGQW